MHIRATQLRPGMIIKHDGELCTVFSVEHRTPGNKRAAMATRLRRLSTGSIADHRFRAEDSIEKVTVEEIEHQYMYNDGDTFHFMNNESFEQIHLSRELLGDAVDYLLADSNVKIEFYDGNPIGVALPDSVDLVVVDTEPTLQKATASSVMKPAKLETGLVIQVPPFINAGDKVKVDTSEGRYIQRTNS